jgi:hypothetical protein
MTKTSEDFLIFVAILYMLIALAAVATAIFASSAAQSYPLYVVKPQTCGWSGDGNLVNTRFVNSSDAYIIETDWFLLTTIGACPKDLRDHGEASGAGSKTAEWEYNQCLKFTGRDDKRVWTDLDTETLAANYTDVHFRKDVVRWENSGRLGQAATFFLYAALASFIISYKFPVTNAFALVSLLITFSLWLGAINCVEDTSMIDFNAWAAWFMESCDVRIVHGGGWYLGVYTLVVSGGFLVMYSVFYIYYLFRTFPLGHPFNPGYLPSEKDGPGGLTAHKSMVHFHKALYLHFFSIVSPGSDSIPEPSGDIAKDENSA